MLLRCQTAVCYYVSQFLQLEQDNVDCFQVIKIANKRKLLKLFYRTKICVLKALLKLGEKVKSKIKGG